MFIYQEIYRKHYELARLEGNMTKMKEFGNLIVNNFSNGFIGSEPTIENLFDKKQQLEHLQNELSAAIQKQQLLNEKEKILEDIRFWDEAKKRQTKLHGDVD